MVLLGDSQCCQVSVTNRGVARILGNGVLEYVREARAQIFKPRPLITVVNRIQRMIQSNVRK